MIERHGLEGWMPPLAREQFRTSPGWGENK
jgi:hypothetical protein